MTTAQIPHNNQELSAIDSLSSKVEKSQFITYYQQMVHFKWNICMNELLIRMQN